MVTALTLLLGAACASNGADRGASGDIVDGGDVSVFRLREGDCFDDPAGDIIEIGVAAGVPCSQPHDNEVNAVTPLATTDFPLGKGDPYPGVPAITQSARDACLDFFEPFVGTDYEDSLLDVGTLWPTEQSWALGDRAVVCFVYRVDLAPMTGTQRGAGI